MQLGGELALPASEEYSAKKTECYKDLIKRSQESQKQWERHANVYGTAATLVGVGSLGVYGYQHPDALKNTTKSVRGFNPLNTKL